MWPIGSRSRARAAEFFTIDQETDSMPSAMHISRWGPAFWTALHTAAYSYPREPSPSDKLHMKAFLIGVGGVLPCKTCCRHYSDFLSSRNMHNIVASRDSVAQFCVDVHNQVNERQSPPKDTYTAKQAEIEWTEQGRSNPDDGNCPAFARTRSAQVEGYVAWFLLLLSSILNGVLGYMVYRCRKITAPTSRTFL